MYMGTMTDNFFYYFLFLHTNFLTVCLHTFIHSTYNSSKAEIFLCRSNEHNILYTQNSKVYLHMNMNIEKFMHEDRAKTQPNSAKLTRQYA